ncbi:MAG: nucleotide exchange factor GrpE, partial [Muribaculum sp.]|nr:nucleotide exchange factor GrpE [Muribaculum sp.]
MDKKYRDNRAEIDQEVDAPFEVNDVEDIESDENEALKDQVQEELDEVESLRQQLADAKAETEKEKKEYLFLMAEFDNFRKRNMKERSELIKNAGEKVLEGLLPIIDDFERSIQAINDSSDASSIREGVELIYNKFVKYLAQNGV